MTNRPEPADRNLLGHWTPWIAGVVVLAAVAGGIAFWLATGHDREPAKLDDAFVYDVDRYRVIPPAQLGWREVATIDTGLARATALAVGPDGRIAVGGDESVLVYSAAGERTATIPLPGTPFALTTSAAGELFVAAGTRIGRCAFGPPVTFFATVPGGKARVTSIAVDASTVYAADAGSRAVWRIGFDGERRGRIGDRDPGRNVPGFSVPSPYFDVLVAPDGLLRIVDPGRHRVTAFTTRGDLEFSWGTPSFELAGFSGCCNPSHLAILPDGRFVTSEKGIPRVKVYAADGTFATAVVGCEGLDTRTAPCDVATDARGRIVVLDPGSRTVRVFEPAGEVTREDG